MLNVQQSAQCCVLSIIVAIKMTSGIYRAYASTVLFPLGYSMAFSTASHKAAKRFLTTSS